LDPLPEVEVVAADSSVVKKLLIYAIQLRIYGERLISEKSNDKAKEEGPREANKSRKSNFSKIILQITYSNTGRSFLADSLFIKALSSKSC
jgi:hypothetical protein